MLVGDIVRVVKDQGLPADLLLLNSSETQGLCYIETANLDGETNLKLYQAIPETTHLTTEQDLANFTGSITAEPPNTRLYNFDGSLTLPDGQSFPLTAKQVLLRGCMLKNTDWVYPHSPFRCVVDSLISQLRGCYLLRTGNQIDAKCYSTAFKKNHS